MSYDDTPTRIKRANGTIEFERPAPGTPRPTKQRLQGVFVKALADDFTKYGVKAVMRAREEDPLGYLKVIASILPKELEIKRPLEEMTEDDLIALATKLKDMAASIGINVEQLAAEAGAEGPKTLQ